MTVRPSLDASFVFAHQGGWDEVLLVVVPLLFIALALWLANKRVSAQLDGTGPQTPKTNDPKANKPKPRQD